jgi:lipid-A-disaccharide synthase
MTTVFISCGETSGDQYAADIISTCSNESIHFIGNGGAAMKRAGATVLFNVVEKSTIGFIEPILKIPFFLNVLRITKKTILKHHIKTVLIIDHQGFNIPLAKWCKSKGVRVISFIAPQFWMWGHLKKAQQFVKTCDHIVCIFEKEYEYYKAIDPKKVSRVDHPLVEALPKRETHKDMIIGLFPGSRQQEVTHCLPLMIATSKILKERFPESRFKLAIASPAMADLIIPSLKNTHIEHTSNSRQLISEATLSLVASGTVSLEHAIIGTPCIVMYKFSPISYAIAALIVLKKLQENCGGFMALPNILLNSEVCPEFLQSEATVDNISSSAINLLNNKKKSQQMASDLKAVTQMLSCNQSPFKKIKSLITCQS